MATLSISENEIRSWLFHILKEENITNVAVEISGTSEQGNGMCGEVIFVELSGLDQFGSTKLYNLAVKCSKSNTALMAQSPIILDAFKNEIYVYQTILPTFRKFQLERGIEKPFSSAPKCFGVYSDECKHVVALENLKKSDFELWNRTTPLTKKHLDLVVQEYAQFHAISIAMHELQPEKFQQLTDGMVSDVFGKFFRSPSALMYFKSNIQELCHLLKDDFDEEILKKWADLKNQVHIICEIVPENLKVITHGDCWNNNFMFKYKQQQRDPEVVEVAVLDWQMSSVSSPVTDLSYFLFSCIGHDDICNLNSILKNYYLTFADNVVKLGSSFMSQYSFENFLVEWKKFSKFGLVMGNTLLKASYLRNKQLADVAHAKTDYKNRMKYIVKYAADFELI